MWILIVLLLIFVFAFDRSGAGEKNKSKYWIQYYYNCIKYERPKYCLFLEDNKKQIMKGDFSIPDFANDVMNNFHTNINEYFYFNSFKDNFPICKEYGDFYSTLIFLKNELKGEKHDVILIGDNTEILSFFIQKYYGLPVFYYGQKHKGKSAKYMGKTYKGDKFKRPLLFNYSVFYTSSSEYDVINDAILTNVYNNYLIDNIRPEGYICLYRSILHEYNMMLPASRPMYVPFTYVGRTPSFYLVKYIDDLISNVKINQNLMNIAHRVLIYNFCYRNADYKGNGLDVHIAKKIFNKEIMNILGPLSDKECSAINLRNNSDYDFSSGKYKDFKFYVPINLLNPPLVIHGNIVYEYGCNTIKRGLRRMGKRLAFFNSIEFYYKLRGFGVFYMTRIPKKLINEPGIVKVIDYADAVVKSQGFKLLPEDLVDKDLINNCVAALKELKMPAAKKVSTNVKVVEIILAEFYDNVSDEYLNGNLFWNN